MLCLVSHARLPRLGVVYKFEGWGDVDEMGGGGVEVEEVAEHAHSGRCRVLYFTVRLASTPPGMTSACR